MRRRREPTARDGSPTTTHRRLSIDVARRRTAVVVTLDGQLDEDTLATLAGVLGDLVVGQGNLSVIVDGHRLTGCDSGFVSLLVALERQAARRGGTLAFFEPDPPSTSPARRRAGPPDRG